MYSSPTSPWFTLDPVWPWSAAVVGVPALLLLGAILAGLTIWTYRGMKNASSRRIACLLFLRLTALVVACLLMLRPSLVSQDDLNVPSVLILAADKSESMTIQDQFDNQTRADYLHRLLRDCQGVLQQLHDEHNVTIVMTQFAEDVGEYDPDGKADGKRTDFGQMLSTLYDRYGGERYMRGLLVLSDGADNGTRFPALALASKWRGLPCPIYTFAFGKTTTTGQQRDISFTGIRADPSPVPIKNKLTVRGTVDAPGFENRTVRVHLLVDDKEVLAKDEILAKTVGNEIQMVWDAPPTAGEIKVALKIDPLGGEVSAVNNEISTFVTVTKEGISVLYVEGKYRAWEPKYIRYALSEEPSITLSEAVLLSDEPLKPSEGDLLDIDKQHYDVIILGDITAHRLEAARPGVLELINKQVFEKGVGLAMIGGYDTFGNSDWDRTPIARLLPVYVDQRDGQVDTPVKMVPTTEGLRHYLLRLADNVSDNAALWNKLPRLDAMTRLGKPKPNATVLAETNNGEPLLVGLTSYGKGRTIAFGGDTTWRWVNVPEGRSAQPRFWRQLVFWLAKRDQADGNVLVLPDTRRLPAGGKLGFTVKLRGTGSVDIPEKDAHFEVKVRGPDGVESILPTARERGDERGTFWKTDAPGEYTLIARGWGTDLDGKPMDNLPPAQARFVIYQDEAEMARQAADHDFLTKLASAGGGSMHQPEELKQFLKDLANLPLAQSKPKTRIWPDWRKGPATHSTGDQAAALAGSGVLLPLVLFMLLLCGEWALRRYWGLV